jgi:hypothetical protein
MSKKTSNTLLKKLFLTILFFVILACSFFVSDTTQTTDTVSLTAVSAAKTIIFLTQMAIPSSTPEPTKTARPPIIMKLHDDFNDMQFDGSINPIRWNIFFNPRCKAFQKDGKLIIIDTYGENEFTSSHSCDLIASIPLYVSYDEIGSFSAKLMAKKQNTDNSLFFQTISFQTYDIKNGIVWSADCGIAANEFGVHFVFNLFPADPSGQILIFGWQSAQYDTWYQVKMELNPDTNTIKCFLDENLFYETLPPRLDEIQSSDFFWTLSSFTGNESDYTELWFDDVYRGR